MKELIRKILKEERMNPIKKFFFNHWDEIRSEGEYPTIDYSLIGKLGFKKKSNEIHDYYLEYIGGEGIGENDDDDGQEQGEEDDEALPLIYPYINLKTRKHCCLLIKLLTFLIS